MLKITNLRFSYGEDKSTYNYDISVNPKEIVIIKGKSGSGKSTLLDLISGFLEPMGGSIVLDGLDILNASIERRPVSILFQQYNLFEHLNVEKNVLLGISRKVFDSKANKEKVDTILTDVGLREFAKTKVSSLSGGQQQRVALARVLLREEPILLLDEPFGGLDNQTHVEMLDLVKRITLKHNLHTLMISHNSNDAVELASRVYEMVDYKLVPQSNI